MNDGEETKSRIPVFSSRQEEAEFWDTHSLTEFEDEWEPVEVTVADPLGYIYEISVRLDRAASGRLKALAAKEGVSTTELATTWILREIERAEAGERAEARA